jgi:hypothetical protein
MIFYIKRGIKGFIFIKRDIKGFIFIIIININKYNINNLIYWKINELFLLEN